MTRNTVKRKYWNSCWTPNPRRKNSVTSVLFLGVMSTKSLERTKRETSKRKEMTCWIEKALNTLCHFVKNYMFMVITHNRVYLFPKFLSMFQNKKSPHKNNILAIDSFSKQRSFHRRRFTFNIWMLRNIDWHTFHQTCQFPFCSPTLNINEASEALRAGRG